MSAYRNLSGQFGRHPGSNPDQLKLFMGARELRDSINFSYDREDFDEYDEAGNPILEDLPQMWNRKVEESQVPGNPHGYAGSRFHGAGIYKHLENHGYDWSKAPIELEFGSVGANYASRLRLLDGHHRVAAAAHIEETTGRHIPIPVSYEPKDKVFDDYYES